MELYIELLLCFFFFFQAEDGIRDWSVTGVQTCALPIFSQTLAPVSYVNLTDFATAAGTVNKASVYWSRACTAAFKVVFLRTGFTTNSSFTVVATRGPFNSVDGRNDVTLIPPVALAFGDLIGVVQLQPLTICGSRRPIDYGGQVGYTLS